MGVMEAVKKGFGISSKCLGLVLILFAFNLIFNLASIPFAAPGQAARPDLAAVAVAFSILFIVCSVFIQSASLALVRDYVKQGKIALSNFMGYALKYYLRLFGLGLLIILIIGIIGLLAALIVIATAPLNNPAITVVAALIAIIIGAVGLYYILLLILAPYIIVCEEQNIIESMKRSIKIVRRSIGKIVLMLVVLILISLGLGFLVGFFAGLVTAALPVVVGQVVIGVINSVFNSYLGVVMMASFMVFYMAIMNQEKAQAQKVF